MFHPFRFAGEPRERKGAAAVEFAIVAPLLFLLILGIIEFARIFMVVQIINNGAREGARKAILPGATQTIVNNTIESYMTNAGLSGHTKTFYVNNSSTTNVTSAVAGDSIKVVLSIPVNNISWLPANFIGFLTGSGQSLSTSVVMRKEDS